MPDERTRKVLRFVAANVRRLRQERGLTQEKLAEKAQLDLRYFQKIESAQVAFNVGILVVLAETLEVEPGLLLEEAELPEPVRGRPPKAVKAPQDTEGELGQASFLEAPVPLRLAFLYCRTHRHQGACLSRISYLVLPTSRNVFRV